MATFLFIFAALFISETDTSSRVCLSSERPGSKLPHRELFVPFPVSLFRVN